MSTTAIFLVFDMFPSFSGVAPAARLLACAFAAGTCISFNAHAHGTHTHGHGTARLTVDGPVVEVSIDVPLESYLGYDYPPHGEAQQQVWDAFAARAGNPLNFIEPAAEARCTVTEASTTPDVGKATPAVDISNMVLAVKFHCEQPAALKSFSLHAFRDHPGLKQLRVQLQLNGQRKTITVRPRFPAITL